MRYAMRLTYLRTGRQRYVRDRRGRVAAFSRDAPPDVDATQRALDRSSVYHPARVELVEHPDQGGEA